MTLGLIGYGRFGSLAARFLSKYCQVVVHDNRPGHHVRSGRNIRAAMLQEVASQPVLVLAVPVSSLRSTLHSIRPFLRPQSLVVDVCAVKQLPVRWMKEILPRNVSILGTHPLLGPDSVRRSLKGRRIIFCPARISHRRLAIIARYLRDAGLHVRIMPPAAHDRMMAETLLVSQYVGRLVAGAGMGRSQFSTASHDAVVSLASIARRDTAELFSDMVRFNPYARRVLGRLTAAHRHVIRR